MTYQTPYSDDSLPSTPGSQRMSYSYMNDGPSTTPAGPPPSSAASFTPRDNPPSGRFGSSFNSPSMWGKPPKLNFAPTNDSPFHGPTNNLFAKQNQPASFARPSAPTPGRSSMRQSTQSAYTDDAESEDDDGYYEDEYAEEEEEMDEDEVLPQPTHHFGTSTFTSVNQAAAQPKFKMKSSIIKSSVTGKRPSDVGMSVMGRKSARRMHPGEKGNKTATTSAIARDLAARAEPALVQEADEVVLGTDDILMGIYEHEEDDVSAPLSKATGDLIQCWSAHVPKTNSSTDGIIGLEDSASGLAKATYLGSLFLPIHHPPPIKSAAPRLFSSQALVLHQPKAQSVPQVLLSWLDTNHNPYGNLISAVQAQEPNPTASTQYWDIIHCLVLRGKLDIVIRLLESADFSYAWSATQDGYDAPGYHGIQQQLIQRSVNRAIQALRACPGVQSNDWEVQNAEWSAFRGRVENILHELEDLAEGDVPEEDDNGFEAENFGITGSYSTNSFSQSTRKAKSQVPWSIYQSLKIVYCIILGDTSEIIAAAQDWIEACVGLTIWWDGEDDAEILRQSLGTSRNNFRRSSSSVPRSVDINTTDAYLRRLGYAFDSVTDSMDEDSFQIDSTNPFEVCIAAVFEGNVEGALEIIQTYSQVVSSAIAEIASVGGWMTTSAGAASMPGFNESDLLVLGMGASSKQVTKDNLLTTYVSEVRLRNGMKAKNGEVKDGWELAMQILTRLDDEVTMKKTMDELLDNIPLTSFDLTNKVVTVASDLGFADESRKLSERYADNIAQTTEEYGTALFCYARAHNSKKLKNVLDLLVSYCLVQSVAYPPKSQMDPRLSALVENPKETFKDLVRVDPDGASLLQGYISGYAALRRFYDLRDEDVSDGTKKSGLTPLARKKAAAKYLTSVITSAADCIHGGLFDAERDSVVQVDGLLALLGEALVFVDQSAPILTLQQTFALLKAIEDLQTVTSRVYTNCEECLQSTLQNFHGTQSPPSPRGMFKKSVSSMTNSSGFSLVGSGMLEGSKSIGSSGVLVKGGTSEAARGWDWRKGLQKGATGDDVLRILRLGLAREVSRCWLDGDDDM